jgi:hypothetical protein
MVVSTRPALTRGALRVVTNVERGMRWTFWLRPTSAAEADEQRRVVPIPRCWDQVSRGTYRERDGGSKARHTEESTL